MTHPETTGPPAAEHAAAQGFEVLTLDCRGIGRSRPAALRGFALDCLDWARLDPAAALDASPEDGLPADVYRQWRRWCSFPRHFFDGPTMASPRLSGLFAAVRTPTLALDASDNHWAPPASRDAFLAACSNAPPHCVTLQSSAPGLKASGHMGYTGYMGHFRPTAQPLWNDMLAWLMNRAVPGQNLLVQ